MRDQTRVRKMKKRLFSVTRADTCPKCGRDRAIELYDKNANPIRFTFVLDTDRNILLDRREIHYGECRFCKARFDLDWTFEDRIPRPLVDIKKERLLQQYSKSKI